MQQCNICGGWISNNECSDCGHRQRGEQRSNLDLDVYGNDTSEARRRMNKIKPDKDTFTGPHFSQNMIDKTLVPLAVSILEWIDNVDNIRVWYDSTQDFHRLSFKANGHEIEVRAYKVFSYTIDGREGWSGCPFYLSYDFVKHIQKAVQ